MSLLRVYFTQLWNHEILCCLAEKPFRCGDKFLKTLPTLTTYSTLAHKQSTFMYLGSVKGKILDKSAFGLLQQAHSKNWFLEILHLKSFNQENVCKHVFP